jgi:NADH-quinone oxidoreductase subunit L
MGVGLLGLVALAAALGGAFAPLEEMLDARAAAGPTAIALGLTAAGAGLLLGWLAPAHRLLGPLHPAARGGFVIGGGLAQWVTGSTLALARGCEKLERGLYAGVLASGRMVMAIGQGVRVGDERGIDGVIASVVQSVRDLGARARALQSGLVHRELALAFTGVVLVLLILAGAAIRT